MKAGPHAIHAVAREWPLGFACLTVLVHLYIEPAQAVGLEHPLAFALLLAWPFAAILASAFAVVRHAESVAVRLGEPLGTLVLTLAVTGIEVMMISAVMLTGAGRSALARDTMFAVVMLVLNGLVGLSLLLGGLRFREQSYNLQGANAFLAVILPLAVLGLVVPSLTTSTPTPTLSPLQAGFVIVMSVGLYGVFLAIQNFRHRDYFVAPDDAHSNAHLPPGVASLGFHAALLLANLLPVILIAKQLATPIDFAVNRLGAPAALGGLLVAVLILAPESLAAVRAALANQLQRAVNILLGSVLATIGLTVPAVLLVGFVTEREIVLGLAPADAALLALSLAVSLLTFASARTNVLQGAVHLLLFVAYVILIFDAR